MTSDPCSVAEVLSAGGCECRAWLAIHAQGFSQRGRRMHSIIVKTLTPQPAFPLRSCHALCDKSRVCVRCAWLPFYCCCCCGVKYSKTCQLCFEINLRLLSFCSPACRLCRRRAELPSRADRQTGTKRECAALLPDLAATVNISSRRSLPQVTITCVPTSVQIYEQCQISRRYGDQNFAIVLNNERVGPFAGEPRYSTDGDRTNERCTLTITSTTNLTFMCTCMLLERSPAFQHNTYQNACWTFFRWYT